MQNTSMANNFPYLYRGIVLDNQDPKHLGRCRIRVPSIHGDTPITSNYLPWARGISNIVIGEERGSASVPDINDIVWVLFEGGDSDYPVYIGGTHGTNDIPVNLDEIVLYQEGTDRILYDRNKQEFLITIGNSQISVGKEDISLRATNIEITGDVKVNGSPL